jgi:hypothetical protein
VARVIFPDIHVPFWLGTYWEPKLDLGTSSYPVRQRNWEDLPIWAGYPKPSMGSHYPKCSLIALPNKQNTYPYNNRQVSGLLANNIFDTVIRIYIKAPLN